MSRRDSREAAVKIIFQNTFTDSRLFKSKEEFFRCDSERYSGTYYGTGDIFASALLGAYMNGKDIFKSTEIALDFTCGAVRRTFEAGTDTRLGVNFEQGISDYIKNLEG